MRLTMTQRVFLGDAARQANETLGIGGGVLIRTGPEMRTAKSLEGKGLVDIQPERVRTPPRAVATAAGCAWLGKPQPGRVSS